MVLVTSVRPIDLWCLCVEPALRVVLSPVNAMLTDLRASGCAWVMDTFLFAVAAHLPMLSHLDVSATSPTTTKRFSTQEVLSDMGVVAVVENCRQLTTLILDGCGKLTSVACDAIREAVTHGRCPSLRRLSMVGSGVKKRSFSRRSQHDLAWSAWQTAFASLQSATCSAGVHITPHA